MSLKKIHLYTLIFFIAVFIPSSFLFAQSKQSTGDLKKSNQKNIGILFTDSSWSAILKKAGKENKFIFVDAYASWCGPCKLLKATTFKNKNVASLFNQNFINVSMDMEKGEGINLSADWMIQSYPTLLVFDAAGKPVLETIGFLKPKDLIEFGKRALNKQTL